MVAISLSLKDAITYSLPCQASQSQSIQTLLEAEKEAQKVVQQARQCMDGSPLVIHHSEHSSGCADRTQRLKDARSEATKEIEAYKAQKEHEFKAYEKSVRTYLINLAQRVSR